VDGSDEVDNDCKCSGFSWPSPRRPRDCAIQRFSSRHAVHGCGWLRARRSWSRCRSRASNLGNRIWGLLARRAVPPQGKLISRLDARPLRERSPSSGPARILRRAFYTATAKSKPHPAHPVSPGLPSRVKPCASTASRLRGLTRSAIPVFWLPCLLCRSLPLVSRFLLRTPEQPTLIAGLNPAPRRPLPSRNP
jgi:hypothetical protein